MFNEDKGTKLFVNDEIIGMARTVRFNSDPVHGPTLLTVFHFGKSARKDAELCQLVLFSFIDEMRKCSWHKRRTKIYISNFQPIDKFENSFFATPAGNGSVVPGEAWF